LGPWGRRPAAGERRPGSAVTSQDCYELLLLGASGCRRAHIGDIDSSLPSITAEDTSSQGRSAVQRSGGGDGAAKAQEKGGADRRHH